MGGRVGGVVGRCWLLLIVEWVVWCVRVVLFARCVWCSGEFLPGGPEGPEGPEVWVCVGGCGWVGGWACG